MGRVYFTKLFAKWCIALFGALKVKNKISNIFVGCYCHHRGITSEDKVTFDINGISCLYLKRSELPLEYLFSRSGENETG